MAKPLSGDQGLASQAHSLQIVLFGPLTCEPNTILWVVTNCVPTITYLYCVCVCVFFFFKRMVIIILFHKFTHIQN